MKWAAKGMTYSYRGKRMFKSGDKLPADIKQVMGKETFDEYLDKGYIVDDSAKIKEPVVKVDTKK